MRWFLATVAFAVSFAGCLEALPSPGTGTTPEGRLLATQESSCGMCWGFDPMKPYDAPQLTTRAVWANGTVAEIRWNLADGDGALHVARGVSFSREALAEVLDPIREGRGAWVADVKSATLAEGNLAAFADALDRHWDPEPDSCCPIADGGANRYARFQEDGTREVVDLSGKELAQGEEFRRVQDAWGSVYRALAES